MMEFIKDELIDGYTVITAEETDTKTMGKVDVQYINREDAWYLYPSYNLVGDWSSNQLTAWHKYRV